SIRLRTRRERDCEITPHAPAKPFACRNNLLPHRVGFGGAGKDQAADRSAADQTVVPAKIMIKDEVKPGRFAGAQSAARAVLNFRFQTTAPEGTHDASVGQEQGLRAALLRAGAAR